MGAEDGDERTEAINFREKEIFTTKKEPPSFALRDARGNA